MNRRKNRATQGMNETILAEKKEEGKEIMKVVSHGPELAKIEKGKESNVCFYLLSICFVQDVFKK